MSRAFVAASSQFLNLGSAAATAYPITMGCAYLSSTSAFQPLMSIYAGTTALQQLYLNDASFNYEAVIDSYEGAARGRTGSRVTGSTTNWNFVVGSFDSASLRRISHNGSAPVSNTATVTITSTYNETYIGRGISTSNYFNGSIAHPFIYSAALSNEEMIALSSGHVSPLAIRPGSLIFYAPYLGRNSPEIDIVAARSLTVTGASSSTNEPPQLWATSRKDRVFVPPNFGGSSLRFRKPGGKGEVNLYSTYPTGDRTAAYVDSAVVSAYPLTMACFARNYDTAASDLAVIAAHGYFGGNYDRFVLYFDKTTAKIAASTNHNTNGNAQALTSTTTSDGAWHHVAGVWNSASDRRVYLDGGGKGTDTTSLTLDPTLMNRIAIGIVMDLGYGPLDGNVASTAMWNAALSDNEIAMLAAGISPLEVRPQNLVFYVPSLGRDKQPIDIVGGKRLTVLGATPDEGPATIPARTKNRRVIIPSWLFDETLHPNAVALTNLSGAYTDIDEDPSVPDGNWLIQS